MIQCKICGHKAKSSLIYHIIKKHNLILKEYYKQHGDYLSPEYHHKDNQRKRNKWRENRPLRTCICLQCKKEFMGNKNRKFCCEECQTKFHRKKHLRSSVNRLKEQRRIMKIKAIEYKGGQCITCGLKGHPAAMDFHHTGKKDACITKLLRSNNWEKIKPELDKCQLKCANCHRIWHYLLFEKKSSNSLHAMK